MTDLKFTEYEQGQRQVLLDLRSVMLANPAPKLKDIDAWAADVLHHIRMDAQRRLQVEKIND
jgi:hypothetical protein